MKRFLALGLCAVILTASFTSLAFASVAVSLNLSPINPSDLTDGANWTFVAKTNTPGSQGITGLT